MAYEPQQEQPPVEAVPPGATPLQYSHPMTARGRPGIVTAVGVMSIVVACLSGLANLSGALSSAMMLLANGIPTPAAIAAAPRPPPTTTTTAPAAGPAATAPAATMVVTGPAGAMANPFDEVEPIAVAVSIAASVAGIGLAIFLLVAGIMMLRDSPRAVGLHWWYVWLKIPLVIVATAATIWLWSGLMEAVWSSIPPAAGTPAPSPLESWMMHLSTFAGAALALAYPVALIFVLRGRRLRNYFNAVRTQSA